MKVSLVVGDWYFSMSAFRNKVNLFNFKLATSNEYVLCARHNKRACKGMRIARAAHEIKITSRNWSGTCAYSRAVGLSLMLWTAHY